MVLDKARVKLKTTGGSPFPTWQTTNVGALSKSHDWHGCDSGCPVAKTYYDHACLSHFIRAKTIDCGCTTDFIKKTPTVISCHIPNNGLPL